MKFKIGVMGSSAAPKDKIIIDKSYRIGKEIAKHGCVLINGATTGFPNVAAQGAYEADGFVLGVSPANHEREHVEKYRLPVNNYSTIIYTGFGFNLRNIINIRTSDAICFIRGSLGTLNEFTIAYEDAKIIGVLKDSGGVADFFDEIITICNKKTKAEIIYDDNPERLVKKVVAAIKKRKKSKTAYRGMKFLS